MGKVLNQKAIKAIKKYQESKELTIGSGRCKHYPSCSNYSIGCYEKFSFVKASILSVFRILRCNPFTKKIYDPVPLTKEEKKAIKEQAAFRDLIIPDLMVYNDNHPNATPEDYFAFILPFSIKNEKVDITLLSDYLYVFKELVKHKKIPLEYLEVYQKVEDYLMTFITK